MTAVGAYTPCDRALLDQASARRERLIRFIKPWADDYHYAQQYAPRLGTPGFGERLGLEDLTDEALERLADRIRRDFWSRRRLDRQNREFYRRAS